MSNILSVIFVIFMCATAFGSTSYVLLVDASGSMDDALPSGERKIDAAKTAAIEFLDGVSSDDEIALMVFYDCDDIRVVTGFTNIFTSMKSSIQAIEPDSYTPIADALRDAADYADSNASYSQKVIILLSDGEETCGSEGDPAIAAQYARQNGISVIHAIGYDLGQNSDAVAQLKQVAQIGGGNYYDARDAVDLKKSLKNAYQGDGFCCAPAFIIPLLLGGGYLAVGRLER